MPTAMEVAELLQDKPTKYTRCQEVVDSSFSIGDIKKEDMCFKDGFGLFW